MRDHIAIPVQRTRDAYVEDLGFGFAHLQYGMASCDRRMPQSQICGQPTPDCMMAGTQRAQSRRFAWNQNSNVDHVRVPSV
jgi:hypothetical protein